MGKVRVCSEGGRSGQCRGRWHAGKPQEYGEQGRVDWRVDAEIDKPVIAAVNGLASGAGVDVSLQCDLRFAAESASFRVSYTAFGLVPGNGGTYFLPRIVGEAKLAGAQKVSVSTNPAQS